MVRHVIIKKFVISITVLLTLLMIGCSNSKTSSLQGYYLYEDEESGYSVVYSFSNDTNTFEGYINSKPINTGTYNHLEDNKYILKGDKEEIEINLDRYDSFKITINHLNNGDEIKLENIDKVPVYYE